MERLNKRVNITESIVVLIPHDAVQVQKIKTKRKNPCRCCKFSLHKNFKLSLGQNITEQTYPKIICRSQKCSVQS